ncbi:MAG: acyl-CoA thioesterase II, partial [bacterium]|nr:acyl-CoA thioesterase II [bacterium]
MTSTDPPKITPEMYLEAQAALIDRLEIEELDQDLYRGQNEPNRTGRIFGGQVAAQSLMAAGRTV